MLSTTSLKESLNSKDTMPGSSKGLRPPELQMSNCKTKDSKTNMVSNLEKSLL